MCDCGFCVLPCHTPGLSQVCNNEVLYMKVMQYNVICSIMQVWNFHETLHAFFPSRFDGLSQVWSIPPLPASFTFSCFGGDWILRPLVIHFATYESFPPANRASHHHISNPTSWYRGCNTWLSASTHANQNDHCGWYPKLPKISRLWIRQRSRLTDREWEPMLSPLTWVAGLILHFPLLQRRRRLRPNS